jgi:hypothetical protein
MRRRTFPHIYAAAFGALVAGACSADSSSDSGPCRTETDCPGGFVCEDGVCVADGCDGDEDCAGGQLCVGGVCVDDTPDGSGDAGTDAGTDAADAADTTDTGDTTDAADTADGDSGADGSGADADVIEDIDWGPLAYTIDPPNDTTGVALDATVRVDFNQPMNSLRFIPANLTVETYEGVESGRRIEYDPTTFVLSLAPRLEDGLLPPATPIYFRMEEFIGTESGETLGDPVVTRFVTRGFLGAEYHEALAATYAPVIYQQIERSGIDTFTSFEFDGDDDLTNNLDSAQRPAPNPGYMYFDVVETDTHFFITYVLYYAGMEQNPTATAEHDLWGVQVIVEKVPADPLGKLWAVTTLQRSDYKAWAMEESWYDGGTVARGEDIVARLDATELEGGRRVPLFVESGAHDACMVGRPSGRCRPVTSGDGAPFEEETRGVVYRPGGVAQRVGDAADDALTYALLPWTEAVWMRRDLTAGDGAPFGGTNEYLPPALDDSGERFRPGVGRFFPATLAYAHDGDSFGELPYTWARDEAFPPDSGLYFVDPAWLAAEKWELPEGASTDYCFNPALGIDARAARVTCTAPDFELP